MTMPVTRKRSRQGESEGGAPPVAAADPEIPGADTTEDREEPGDIGLGESDVDCEKTDGAQKGTDDYSLLHATVH